MTRTALHIRQTFAALAWLACTGLAHGGAPPVEGQAPGWYRMPLGAFEVTALSDGTVALNPEELLTHTTPAKVHAALERAHLQVPVDTSVNGFLFKTPTRLVLIDSGAAGLFGPTLGKLVANLRASGYTPEQVDEVYLTHMHPDHVGGLTGADGKRVFPNAIVRADKREADYWLSAAQAAKAPAAMQDFFKGAQASMKPYLDAGKFKPFSGDTDLVPGFRSYATRGHTPGHASYVVTSNGQKMVVWGDLIHVGAVQLPDPSVTIKFDTSPRAAAPQRKKALAAAAKDGYFVAAAHLAFPGIGQMHHQGKGYRWEPVSVPAK
jgi:glyoxylase-like metal-dependent hydrolase (beta-lactamase superfamily II)